MKIARRSERGPLVCLYAYDGLGRLIRKQTPVNVGETYVQTKDYTYDGVRRIQEVITRPIDSPGGDPGGTYQTGGGSRNDELPMGRADGGIVNRGPLTDLKALEQWAHSAAQAHEDGAWPPPA